MVIADSLDHAFKQQLNSCILSSYAVVAKYYTGVDIQAAFIAYCEVFGIHYSDILDAELRGSDHLNMICNDVFHWKGYQMIHSLHNTAHNPYFENNRLLFESTIFTLEPPSKEKFDDLITMLLEGDSLANTLVGRISPFHSLTIGYDPERGLFIHDTQAEVNMKISEIEESLPVDLRECIYYEAI